MASVTIWDRTITTADLSCSAVGPAVLASFGWGGWSSSGCSASPVSAGTVLTFTNNTSGQSFNGTVASVVSNVTGSSVNCSQACTITLVSAVDQVPFDYAYAGAIWSMAFCFVLGLYLISKKAGLILDFIRRN